MSQTPPQAHRDRCAHPPCNCNVEKDRKYCSEECASADSTADTDKCPCPCGDGCAS